MKKQTAVEWLVEQILVDFDVYNFEDDFEQNKPKKAYYNSFQSHVDLSFYVQQALAMEKEQIMEAYIFGRNNGEMKSELNINDLLQTYNTDTQ